MPKRLTDTEMKARANKIWARREENGGEITELLGVRNYYCAYKLFESRGVDVPEPDDSPMGKMAARARLLNSSGKDVLTTREVSDLLDLGGAAKARECYGPIAKHFDVPKMIYMKEDGEGIKMPPYSRITIDDLYPSTLQVGSKSRLADGRVVYKLR